VSFFAKPTIGARFLRSPRMTGKAPEINTKALVTNLDPPWVLALALPEPWQTGRRSL